MHELVFAVAGATFLLGAVALAIRVDLGEARAAPPVTPWAPQHPPELRSPERVLRVVRFEG